MPPVPNPDTGATGAHKPTAGRAPVPLELGLVWLLLALVATEIVVTYARLPPRELYHVSGRGLAGGLGRALVFANWPVALVAIATVLAVAERLPGRGSRTLAALSVLLCAVVAWPGVVEQADLDPKPVNALPAAGVALALALAAAAARRHGVRLVGGHAAGWRLAAGVLALALSLPWLAADLGVYLDRLPGLGDVLLSGELRTQPGDPTPHPAVHHGHHHGMDGTLLVVCGLLLVPTVAAVAGRLGTVLSGYVALMLTYGAANLANDVWLEQVVKRGWTSREIPDVTVPSLGIAWAVIAVGAAALWASWLRRQRRLARKAAPAETIPAPK